MRKFLISAALLSAAAVSVATPAEAQYRNPGYGQGYGNGYGNGYGQFRGGGIRRELAEIRQQIRLGFDRGMVSRGEAARRSRDADRIEQRLQRRAWDGLDFHEREDLQRRVLALRERLRFERFDNRRDRRW